MKPKIIGYRLADGAVVHPKCRIPYQTTPRKEFPPIKAAMEPGHECEDSLCSHCGKPITEGVNHERLL